MERELAGADAVAEVLGKASLGVRAADEARALEYLLACGAAAVQQLGGYCLVVRA